MEKQGPYFFKIVIAGFHSQRMKIPPDFVKYLTEDMSDQKETLNATIKGEAGSWIVELKQKITELYMESGWDKVMTDNSLGDYEFLLIRYNGNLCFDLKIFEKSGIQRSSSLISGGTRMKIQQERNKTKKWMNIRDIVEPSSSSYGVPYFKVLMKAYNVENPFSLRFPVEFTRTQFPGLETGDRKTFVIENAKKEVWKVTAIAHLNSLMMSKGWRIFVRGNRLKPGHVCIFQYLGNNKLRLLVQ